MCGIAGIVSPKDRAQELEAMLRVQHHRGPDFTGSWKGEGAFLGHNRLSIIDLDSHSNQPFISADGRYVLTFNGEIYNYIEIRKQLPNYTFTTSGDTEVLLAAYQKWGPKCLDKFRGMFAFAIYDTQSRELFAARDRFGVKPFHYATVGNEFIFSSEIKAILATGIIQKKWNEKVWSNYLSFGQYNMEKDTFYQGIHQLEPGCSLTVKDGKISKTRYYSFEERIDFKQWEGKSDMEVKAIVKEKLVECINLRLRADVKRGFNLSGGVDSTLLFSLIRDQLEADKTRAFTFYSNDKNYDELDWVNEIVGNTGYAWEKCLLEKDKVIDYATKIQWHQDEPFSGLATIAYSRTFEEARKNNFIVVLDGSGVDEQVGGYDYYYNQNESLVQGMKGAPTRPNTLLEEFRKKAHKYPYQKPFEQDLLNLQYRDICHTKLPRALRMTDRVSMAFSTEMREPFVDHELMELCFSLPLKYKLRDGKRKWIMREIIKDYLDSPLTDAPKRPIQTPQREWLSGPLKDWVADTINFGLDRVDWLNKAKVKQEMDDFFTKDHSNSFYIWQWVSLGLLNN